MFQASPVGKRHPIPQKSASGSVDARCDLSGALPRTIANGDGWGSFGRREKRVGVWAGKGEARRPVVSVGAPREGGGEGGWGKPTRQSRAHVVGVVFLFGGRWSDFMMSWGYVCGNGLYHVRC